MTELHVPAGSIAGMVFSLVVAWYDGSNPSLPTIL